MHLLLAQREGPCTKSSAQRESGNKSPAKLEGKAQRSNGRRQWRSGRISKDAEGQGARQDAATASAEEYHESAQD